MLRSFKRELVLVLLLLGQRWCHDHSYLIKVSLVSFGPLVRSLSFARSVASRLSALETLSLDEEVSGDRVQRAMASLASFRLRHTRMRLRNRAWSIGIAAPWESEISCFEPTATATEQTLPPGD